MKYLQIYPTAHDSPTMLPDYLKHLRGEQGYEVLMSSTPYNWLLALDGHMCWSSALPEVKLDNGEVYELEDGDVVHVHLHGEAENLVSRLKSLNKDLIIIASVDYGLNLWKECLGFTSVEAVAGMVRDADFIFSTEPQIALLLERELKRKVPLIPHPVNTSHQKFRKPFKVPRVCAINIHHYDMDWYLPHLVLSDVQYLNKIVFGVEYDKLPALQNRTAGNLYNEIHPYVPFQFLVDDNLTVGDKVGGQLSYCYCSFDSYSYRVTGRWQSDCAVLGLPCVGSNLQYFQKILFPACTTDYYDIDASNKIMKRLLDKDFYEEVTSTAERRLEIFNFKNTKRNLMAWIYGTGWIDFKEVSDEDFDNVLGGE